MDASRLKAFNARSDGVLSNLVSMLEVLELDDLLGAFQPKLFYDSITVSWSSPRAL